jgi:hypothetical protein
MAVPSHDDEMSHVISETTELTMLDYCSYL